MNNITYAVSVDVNNPIIPYNVYVASVLDSNVRYLEITLYQNGNVIALSNEATATASLVTDDVLIDDSVECTISNNIITVPLEDLQRHGNLDVQVTVAEGEKVLAIPFPIQVRVTPNIAEEAQIDENSMGSYAEVVQEIAEARNGYDSLDERLNSDASGMEAVMHKVQSIGSQSQTFDNVNYPSVTAVRDYVNIKTDDLDDYIEGELVALDEAKADKTDTNAQFERLIAVLQNKAGKAETLAGYGINDAYTKAEVDALDEAKVSKPSTSPNGTNGQLLRTKGDGTTEWVDVIDSTLSTQGAAAEAKATGAEINDLKTALTDGYVVSSNLFNPNTITADKRIAPDGSLYDQSGDYLSDYIPVLEGQILCFCKKWGNMISRAAARSVCAFDSSKTVITSSAVTTLSYSYTVPSGVSFVRIGIVSGSNQSITVTPADVMVFLSDTDSPSSYTFEEWFEPGLKPKASLADNANGGVDISLFGSVKTLAKQSDMAAVETSVSAAQKVSVVRYSRGDNLYYCYETYENDGSIYIALLGSGGLQSENPFLSISFSTLKTALSSYVDTSPDGIECIRLDHRRALLYDYESKTFSIADVRGRTGGSKLIIAQCAHGMLSDGVMHNIIVKEKVDRNTKSLAYRSRSDSDVYSFAKRVQQDQTDKTLTILFMTDTHLDSSNHPFWENNVDFVEKFGSVTRHCGVGLAVHGGDILTTGYTDKTVPLETLNRFCAVMRSNTGNVPMFIIKGNHDDNSYGQKVGGVQQFNYAKTALIYPEQCGVCMFSAAHNDRSLVFDPENPNGGYCYYDDEISKIRVIMLNTNDNPSTMTGDNYNWNSTRSGFQERQLEWLSDVLKFEDRQDAAEWAVYIVSHIPIEISHNRDGDNHGTWFGMGGSLTNGNIFFDILHAYENGTSGTSSSASGTNADWSAEVSYSFSRQGNFIGFLCGHMHADNTSDEIGGATGTEYGYRYIGITAGLTFAAVTIDRENNSVSVRKYGGYNHITEDDNYYDSIIGLTDEDVNEYGDFTVEY